MLSQPSAFVLLKSLLEQDVVFTAENEIGIDKIGIDKIGIAIAHDLLSLRFLSVAAASVFGCD